jgi:hypothetical protein
VKHDEFAGEVWMECALFGALWLAAEDGITDFAWPTGDAAMEEERTEKHRGLYFTDERRLLKKRRVYHPNYFASFRQWLKSEPIFEFLVGNQGLIHRAQGDEDLAQRRFAEAALFGRRRVSGRPASP